MTISERMFQIMEEKQITQYRLSKMTGISTKTISDWRNKKTNPGADKIMVICEALQVSPEMLLTGRGRTEVSDGLPDIENAQDITVESQLVNGYRSFSDEKKRRLMAYLNMLENTKE
ncbi:MAG: helix-turn-helix transcriptional regulator [Eubacterium sp.]|nr:helix-turn-helix transcriptional regulator [Lachnospiraceae bacterium]MBQ9872523.1 helix-turn-helix transcriptional regulator [Eubacterium sp.]